MPSIDSSGFLLAFPLLVCLAACGSSKVEPIAAVAPAPSKPLGVNCLGRILPGARVIRVSAPPQSIVKQLRVQRGAAVLQGQELALLQGHDAAVAALAEAQQQVVVSESIIAQSRAIEKPGAIAAQESAARRQQVVLQNAEKDFERKQELFRSRLIATTEFEAAKFALDTARHDLTKEEQLSQNQRQIRNEDVVVAEKQLALAQTKVARAKADLNLNRVVAPVSATVLEINAYPGEAVTDQGILDLGDTNKMFVEAEVYISDVPRVRLHAKATITGEGFTGSITGEVVEILNQVNDSRLFPRDPLTTSDKRVLGVRIQLDDSQKVLHLSNSEVSVHIEP